MTSRIVIIFIVMLGFWSLLLLRAIALQVFPNDKLEALKSRQFQTVINLQSRRGAITDRNGRELAISVKASSIYADPGIIENRSEVSRKLATLLGYKTKDLFLKIKDYKKRFVWLRRFLEPEIGEAIKKMNIRGIQVVDEYRRVYPNEDLMGSALGFVGTEGRGLEGIEFQLNEMLSGSRKKVVVLKDARGRPLVNEGMMFTENPEGVEVKLTVDADLQYQLEKELKEAIRHHEASAAYGVILDANTSAILAMANLPGFNPNSASHYPESVRRNRTVTDAFEPGSTLKTFVVGAALKAGILAPNTKYNTENGKLKIGDRVIKEADQMHKWKNLTVSEILAFSSNIGTTKIAFDLGPEVLRTELAQFGFGSKLDTKMPGEAAGSLQPLPWNLHLLSNVSFGHGISASPLQIANAYASIANGGTLNTPYIAQAFRDVETGKFIETKPKKIRTVLEPSVANSLKMILAGVTAPGGTGVNAKVDGYLVAGKTGTAQKVDMKNGGYLKDTYISSFVGFIPANEPRFVIYIAVDEPSKHSYYGSQVAAPVFSKVAGYAVRKEGLAPVVVTDKTVLAKVEARIQEKQIPWKSAQNKALAGLSKTQFKFVPDLQVTTNHFVPDLENLTAREVLQKLSGQSVEVRFRGTGLVSETIPIAGQQWNNSKVLTVILR